MSSSQDHQNPHGEDDAMIQYLLGALPGQWRAQLEERLFTDQECFDKLLLSEDRLIEAYLRGELAERERARFEKNFLSSPRRRERTETTAAMLQALAAESHPAAQAAPGARSAGWREVWRGLSGPLKLVILLGALALLGGGAWLVADNVRLRAQRTQLQREVRELQQRLTRPAPPGSASEASDMLLEADTPPLAEQGSRPAARQQPRRP
jgi:anti-sigma factor RsiW